MITGSIADRTNLEEKKILAWVTPPEHPWYSWNSLVKQRDSASVQVIATRVLIHGTYKVECRV